jgi:hypothetical protein
MASPHNIALNWPSFLREAGAVKWTPRVKALLVEDTDKFKITPNHSCYYEAASRAYYHNTRAWQCLCSGDRVANPEDRY